ncbi:MAG: PBP1A family penicillin-binding protein [Nitrospiria bacterium]
MKKKKNKVWARVIWAGSFLVFLAALAYLIHLDEVIVKQFEGPRWQLPSKIYSAPLTLSRGLDIGKKNLAARLKRLSYRRVSHPVRMRGEYYQDKHKFEIYLHAFDYPDHSEKGAPVRLTLTEKGRIHRIIDMRRISDLSEIQVEPEVIGGFFESDWEERRLIALDEVPKMLIDAILVMEDRRFYEHLGINLKGIARAAWVNLWAGKIVQGGSTLTQQLVKNFFLESERTWRRKIPEALMALLLERRYSKEEILEAYLNEIYLGQNGIMGIYGIGQGSWFYFRKAPSDLTLGEAALLAGMIRSPNIFSPTKDVDRATRRRNLVLETLFSEGKISLQPYLTARAERVSKKELEQRLKTAPYFVDQIRREVMHLYPARVVHSGGLQIFTTLDVEMQQIGETSLKEGLEALERKNPGLTRSDPTQQLQGALVAIDPENGAVRAIVGGRDYRHSQFNRVTDAKRQPGSSFKPIVYLTAFEQAANGGPPYTPISRVDDAPITIHVGGKNWSPENYDKRYLGSVTLRAALERSRNAATVRLSQEIGMKEIVKISSAIGIQSPLMPIPSLALGSIEVTPLEMGMAYSTLANGGIRHPPKFLKGIIDPRGLPIDRIAEESYPSKRVVSEEAAFQVTNLLQGVIDEGTGGNVRKLGFDRPAAGKTGTTSHLRDAWFAGYTPDLVTVVWVGFDQNPKDKQNGRISGASAALPIWTDFMKKGLAEPATEFTAPSRIIFRKVTPAGIVCDKNGIEEAFIEGTEPTQSCEKGIIKWFKKLFF